LSQRVLITGAAGRIGRVLRAQFQGRYALLRLLDLAPQDTAGDREETIKADLGDLEALKSACAGIDTVVHMAGIPTEAPWPDIIETNIVGTVNVFEAARLQRVRRVIFASSNHVVGFHSRNAQLDAHSEFRPDSRYGVSKVFGEALGRMYADKYGLSVACLRIGPFRTPDQPAAPRELMNWISHRDMAKLVALCIEHSSFHYLIAYGVSNNRRNMWSNEHIEWLGYSPQDDAEDYAATELVRNAAPEDPVAVQFHGGRYCSMEFVGDLQRVK
jgi:uronate dehydrogenase